MYNNKRIFIFTLLSLLYISIQLASADDNNNAGPARPELVDTDHYIVVFKPGIPSLKISNSIQKLKLHQVNNSKNKTATAKTNDTYTITTSTNNTSSSFINNKKKEYNTIGTFRWYSAQFHTQAFENHFTSSDNDTSMDAVHYYVKDAKFSLQTFVQTNPPSWVSR